MGLSNDMQSLWKQEEVTFDAWKQLFSFKVNAIIALYLMRLLRLLRLQIFSRVHATL